MYSFNLDDDFRSVATGDAGAEGQSIPLRNNFFAQNSTRLTALYNVWRDDPSEKNRNQVYKNFYYLAWRCSRKFSQSGQDEGRREMIQSAMEKLLKSRVLEKFDPNRGEAAFQTYVITSIRNAFFTHVNPYKHVKKAEAPLLFSGDDYAWEGDAKLGDPVDAAGENEIKRRLNKAYASLTPKQKAVFVEIFLHESAQKVAAARSHTDRRNLEKNTGEILSVFRDALSDFDSIDDVLPYSTGCLNDFFASVREP